MTRWDGSWTRRRFLHAGANVALIAAAPKPLFVHWGKGPELVPPIEDPRLKPLAMAAVDAARSAGARYADVRLTHTLRGAGSRWRSEELSLGVRALVDGYWGFASSPTWSTDEAARLGREAAGAAQANVVGGRRVVELATVPVVRDGHWETPIQTDPFTVADEEVKDYTDALQLYFASLQANDPDGLMHRRPGGGLQLDFQRQEKAFASTDGSYWTQRLYRASVSYMVIMMTPTGMLTSRFNFPFGNSAGAGWEYFRDAVPAIRAAIPRLVEECKAKARFPVKTMPNPGRFDVVFDAESVAGMLGPTIGMATELDRVMGSESNAGGTSYITDPAASLGTLKLGSANLTVTANRTMTGGLATVKWDDEGAPADEFTLVNKGILAGFVTSRETSSWLATRPGAPALASHACVTAPNGIDAPLLHVPNLAMQPGQDSARLDDLAAGLDKGMVIEGAHVSMDFQQSTGFGMHGTTWEIQKGKRVARYAPPPGFLFRSTELWTHMVALGGRESFQWFSQDSEKGEPPQTTTFSVGAVPIVVQDLTMIDLQRGPFRDQVKG
jgi:TldD protein